MGEIFPAVEISMKKSLLSHIYHNIYAVSFIFSKFLLIFGWTKTASNFYGI